MKPTTCDVGIQCNLLSPSVATEPRASTPEMLSDTSDTIEEGNVSMYSPSDDNDR